MEQEGQEPNPHTVTTDPYSNTLFIYQNDSIEYASDRGSSQYIASHSQKWGSYIVLPCLGRAINTAAGHASHLMLDARKAESCERVTVFEALIRQTDR